MATGLSESNSEHSARGQFSQSDSASDVNKYSSSKPLTILISGKIGVGKSTLVKSFLRLPPDSTAVSTAECQLYSGKAGNNFPVNIIDIPVFAANNMDDSHTKTAEAQQIEKISRLSEEYRPDIVFYCASLIHRFDTSEFHNIKMLSSCFGNEIWNKAVLILTNADLILNSASSNLELEEPVEIYRKEFQDTLTKAGCTVSVRSIYSFQPGASLGAITKLPSKKEYDGIIGLPVSNKENVPGEWKNALIVECLRVCHPNAIRGLLYVQGYYLTLQNETQPGEREQNEPQPGEREQNKPQPGEREQNEPQPGGIHMTNNVDRNTRILLSMIGGDMQGLTAVGTVIGIARMTGARGLTYGHLKEEDLLDQLYKRRDVREAANY